VPVDDYLHKRFPLGNTNVIRKVILHVMSTIRPCNKEPKIKKEKKENRKTHQASLSSPFQGRALLLLAPSFGARSPLGCITSVAGLTVVNFISLLATKIKLKCIIM